MSSLDDLWVVPAPDLDRDALMLLDWSISSASHLSMDSNLEELMEWKEFRSDVWGSLLNIESQIEENRNKNHQPPKPPTSTLYISTEMASRLLAIVPVTFRWGTHDDCGFPLKVKLAKIERGENPNAESDTNQDPDQAVDTAGPQPPAGSGI